MDRETDRTADVVPATLEHEMRLINEAIALVASGAATRRTVVAGLRLGDELLETAQRMADEAGVRLVPLWHADEHGIDIAVERRPAVTDAAPAAVSSRTTRASAGSSPGISAARATRSRTSPPPRTPPVRSTAACGRRSSCSTSTCPATPVGTCCAGLPSPRPARRRS